MPANSATAGLRARVRAEVRPVAGVYTLFDAQDTALYVGKSVNLRARLLTHLNAGMGLDNPQRHLAFAVSDFAVRETAGELLALLLEDALIKALAPRANTRQRDYREYCYLALSDDAFPTLRVVEWVTERPPGIRFGPYRDRFAAQDLLELVHEHFGLRSCLDAVPHRRSSNFDLGRCSGPCRGAVTPGEYALMVDRAASFLRGDGTWVAERLAERIEAEAAVLRFEEAGRLKATRDFCERYTRRRALIAAFESGPTIVREADLVYEFGGGALTDLHSAAAGVLAVPPELRDPPGDPRFLFDRANVVYDWMRR